MYQSTMRKIKLGSDQIFYGENSVDSLRELPAKKVAIIMSGNILEKVGLLKKVTDNLDLANIQWATYDQVGVEPNFEEIYGGVEFLRTYQPDWIIGFGGGSAMDAAKVMWVYYENPKYTTLEDVLPPKSIETLNEKAHLCCIPTSAGTGSEVTRAAIVTNSKTKSKHAVREINGGLIPTLAILDPIFTETMPKSLVAASGMDALTHAIESYVSTTANTFSDTLSLGAFIEGYKNLQNAYENNDTFSRDKMLVSSTLGGIAFSNCGLGIVHSIAHSIGAEFNIPHGLANALILPYGIGFNSQNELAKQKYEELAYYIKAQDLKIEIENLNKVLSIPSKLKELVDENDFNKSFDILIDKALEDVTLTTNPIQPTKEEMGQLIKKIYFGS